MFPDAELHDDVEKISTGVKGNAGNGSISSQEDPDTLENATFHGESDRGRQPSRSVDLKRSASHEPSRVTSRLTTRSIPEPPPPPDGGLHAWTQVACGFVVMLTTWGWVNSYGAFQSYYDVSLNLDPSTISWIGSVQNFVTFFVGTFSGRLLDAGYFTPCFVVGSVIQVLGIFFMSLSTKYWQLMLTQGIMTGIGGSWSSYSRRVSVLMFSHRWYHVHARDGFDGKLLFDKESLCNWCCNYWKQCRGECPHPCKMTNQPSSLDRDLECMC